MIGVVVYDRSGYILSEWWDMIGLVGYDRNGGI
jgi:hypothetical protein